MKFCLIHSASESCRKLQNWLGFSSRIYESGLKLRFIKGLSQSCFSLEFQKKCFAHFLQYISSCQHLLGLCPALPKYWNTHFGSSFLYHCYALNCATTPFHLYVEVLTPTASECDLIWRQGFIQVFKLK